MKSSILKINTRSRHELRGAYKRSIKKCIQQGQSSPRLCCTDAHHVALASRGGRVGWGSFTLRCSALHYPTRTQNLNVFRGTPTPSVARGTKRLPGSKRWGWNKEKKKKEKQTRELWSCVAIWLTRAFELHELKGKEEEVKSLRFIGLVYFDWRSYRLTNVLL